MNKVDRQAGPEISNLNNFLSALYFLTYRDVSTGLPEGLLPVAAHHHVMELLTFLGMMTVTPPK